MWSVGLYYTPLLLSGHILQGGIEYVSYYVINHILATAPDAQTTTTGSNRLQQTIENTLVLKRVYSLPRVEAGKTITLEHMLK